MDRSFRNIVIVIVVLLATIGIPLSANSYAQTDIRSFSETGHTLRGAFRYFWETNGELRIFGYPITEEYISSETGRLTQYFERARFELIEQNGVYTVDIGKLGVEFSQNRIFPKSPPVTNTNAKRYIPQTQHVIQYGFKEIWEKYGEDRVFGFPISEEIDEILDDGKWHIVQYFERARFEYWPMLPPGERVLISTLGRKLVPATLPNTQPTAPPNPLQPTLTAVAPVPTPALPSPTALPVRPNCDPAYPTVCIPPPPPDLDCDEISYRDFKVLSRDPHNFDSDNDGVGCES